MKNLLITCADARLNTETYNVKVDAGQLFNTPDLYEIKLPGPDAPSWQGSILRAIEVFNNLDDISVLIVGHEDCAGHPCSPVQHEIDIKALQEAVQEEYPTASVEAGICRKVSDEDWHVEKI